MTVQERLSPTFPTKWLKERAGLRLQAGKHVAALVIIRDGPGSFARSFQFPIEMLLSVTLSIISLVYR